MRLRVVTITLLLLLAACQSSGEQTTGIAPSPGATALAPAVTEAPIATPAASEPDAPAPTEGDTDAGNAETAQTDPVQTDGLNSCQATPQQGRVDLTASGNRISALSLDLATAPHTDVQLPARPLWVLADPGVRGGWHVRLEDGSAIKVDAFGAITPATAGAEEPPLLTGTGQATSAQADRDLFPNPLSDTRVVFGRTDGDATGASSVAAALVDPTERYPHGVLGDRIEAGGITLLDRCEALSTTITIGDDDVIEGTSPMLADVDGDGTDDVLVTLSNSQGGARLALYNTDAELLGESEPIGQGNRWRNQMAVAPVGPNGELEIIDVRTPHIGGRVQFFRLIDGVLEMVAATESRFTSHVIGSRNLDMGFVADGDGDGLPEVIVLTSDRNSIVVIERVEDGTRVVAEIDTSGSVTTNLAPNPETNELAIGLADGRLRIYRG